jgi:hypothetical protein
MPPQIKRHVVMRQVRDQTLKLQIAEVARDHRSIGGHAPTDHVLWVKELWERASEEKLSFETPEARRARDLK